MAQSSRTVWAKKVGTFCFLFAGVSGFALSPALAQSTVSDGSARQIDFSIAPQSLTSAMRDFSNATHIQAVYASSVGTGVASPGVKGRMAAGEALSRLLAGTGLTYQYTGAQSVTLEPVPTTSSEGVLLGTVRVVGQSMDDGDVSRSIGTPPPIYSGGQVARGARVGILGNLDALETPFNITSYTTQLIENQQSRTIGDVLDNDPSIRRAWPASGLYEYFQVRGLYVTSSNFAFNGLFGMVPRYGAIPADFAERIEVIKGPSALLSGMSPDGLVGGAINIVPKRASDVPLTRLSVGLMSDSLVRGHLDVGRRFGSNGEWGVRVNATVEDGDTYISGQSKRGNNTESIALDYRGESLRLALDAYHTDERNRGGAAFAVSIGTGLTSMPRAPIGSTNISPWVNGNSRTDAVMLSGEYDINDHIIAFAKGGVRRYRYTGYLLSTVNGLTPNGDVSAVVSDFPYKTHGDTEEVGIRGKFETGSVKHEVVLSGSHFSDYVDVGFSLISTLTNIYNPRTNVVLPTAPAILRRNSQLNFGSIALADTVRLLDDKVIIIAGIRRQNVKSRNFNISGLQTVRYDKSAWTPMAGLVIKVKDGVSLYANYIEGLSQGTTVSTIYLNAGEVFPPYKSKQIEAGVKAEIGNVITTLSAFQIKKPATLVDNSTTPLPTLRLDGEQRNRGVEWNVMGSLTQGLRVLGGATYIAGRLTHTQGGLQDGNDAPGAAPFATNIGVEWDVPALEGFTLTGRLLTTSSQFLDNANTIKLPAWARVDIGARLAVDVGRKPFVFRAGIENLLDKNYWEGVNAPGAATLAPPRTFQISASVDL